MAKLRDWDDVESVRHSNKLKISGFSKTDIFELDINEKSAFAKPRNEKQTFFQSISS